ncbi:MAG: cell division topological specificity factor MinE [Roseburia sp.]|nr:cell division topological specificity factor MinE [Roseburia sp.]
MGEKNQVSGASSGTVAKERLKLMMDAEKQKLDDDTLKQIRQEIGTVITKYVDIEPENVEVKVLLKDYKKKE